MELREKIVEQIVGQMDNCAQIDAGGLADAILDIPAIKEALALREKWLDSPSGPPLTTPEEIDAWFKSVRHA